MRHTLFAYRDDDQMVEKVVPFLRPALAPSGRAVVIVERAKWERLAEALEFDALNVRYVDRDTFYARPETALAGYDGMLRRSERDGATEIRVFAELPRCVTAADVDRWLSYEAIVNRALAHHRFWVMCGYDRREMSGPLLQGGLDTHPEVLEEDSEPSPRYHDPEDVVRSRTPTPTRLRGLHELPLDGGGPTAFRAALREELHAALVPEVEAENMLVAAGEVLANAERYGSETVNVQVGRVGNRFVCQISDDGPGIDDPLAGFLPPRPGHTEGAGLWVARQLTRQLELVPSPTGATVRLWV
jgi:anti-sigma regulatory factor (Ser/Thr protein kinase)